jgi:hypothetical protein
VTELLTLVAPLQCWIIHAVNTDFAPPQLMLEMKPMDLLLEMRDFFFKN